MISVYLIMGGPQNGERKSGQGFILLKSTDICAFLFFVSFMAVLVIDLTRLQTTAPTNMFPVIVVYFFSDPGLLELGTLAIAVKVCLSDGGFRA